MNPSMSLFRKLAPQTQTVLLHLIDRRSITPVEAATVYKVRSLSSRISELKKTGISIKRMYLTDGAGQRYAKYYL